MATGAFAAHSLKQVLAADALQVFETAVRYQFYHVFALIATGILYQHFPGKMLLWAGRMFLTGILLFSGSLYMLCYIKHAGLTQFLWAGAVTPLGGVCFMAGWILLAAGIAKKN